MTEILAIIFLVLWIGFTLFYALSDDWFGTDGWLGKTLGSTCWALITTLGIYSVGFIFLLLLSLGMGIR